MLKAGDKVLIRWYEDSSQATEGNWLVLEYDNGLVKLKRGSETRVMNMRCMAFVSAEIG